MSAGVARDEFAWLEAAALATLVHQRAVRPDELVDAALDRIARLDPRLNAIVVPLEDSARASSAEAGPLRGVPLLVKDFAASAGDPCYQGMRLLAEHGWRDDHDQVSIARLKAAGAVICGKTNLCELGTSITTEPDYFGPTRNPWDLDRSAGGSSGGSAAAVAAGMVPAAHGTDGGGSVRIPAARCGLIGLKPSRARIPPAPKHGELMGGLLTEGVLSRTVRDAAALLDVMAGPAPGDPYACPDPERPWVDEVGRPPGRLRIGVMRTVPGRPRPLHAACTAAVDAAAALLIDLGHDVEEDAPRALDDPALGSEGPKLYWASYARMVQRWERLLHRSIGSDDLEPLTWAFVDRGRRLPSVDYLSAQQTVQAMARDVAAWHRRGFDVLMTSTTAEPPPLLGEWVSTPDDPLRAAKAGMATFQLNSFANYSGQPAISLPLAQTRDGLPLGIQLVTPLGREDVLLRLAAQVEEAGGWADRRPPLV